MRDVHHTRKENERTRTTGTGGRPESTGRLTAGVVKAARPERAQQAQGLRQDGRPEGQRRFTGSVRSTTAVSPQGMTPAPGQRKGSVKKAGRGRSVRQQQMPVTVSSPAEPTARGREKAARQRCLHPVPERHAKLPAGDRLKKHICQGGAEHAACNCPVARPAEPVYYSV